MLGDQAAYCLSGGARHCPRFRADEVGTAATAGFVPLYATAEEAWRASDSAADVDYFDMLAGED